jgi:hypothetical protein
MAMLEAALNYLQTHHFSVIPLKPAEKVSYVRWAEYQERRPTAVQLTTWLAQWPEANIAVVLGKVSGVVCIDCDSAEADNFFRPFITDPDHTPTVTTGRGHHYYFKYEEGLRSTNRIHPGLEYRSDGHIAVLPPSIHHSGNIYSWEIGLVEADPPALPAAFAELIKKAESEADSTPYQPNPGLAPFEEGRRDDDLFHLANQLVKAGTDPGIIIQTLNIVADKCGFPQKDVPIKVKSAMDRAYRRERNVAGEVRELVTAIVGNFSVQDIYSELKFLSNEEREAARKVLLRLCSEGAIERNPWRYGSYRKIETDIEEMDWRSASIEPLDIRWPLGIDNFYQTYPKSIAVVAGGPDFGKSQFCFEFTKMNLDKEIHFFSSESGPSDLKHRITLQKDTNPEMWGKVHIFERNADFASVIKPDGINVIDYIEIGDSFWLVNKYLSDIFAKLTTGIVLAAIQKNPKTREGIGGYFGLQKPRLYFTLDQGLARVLKCKTKKPGVGNMSDMVCHFYADASTIYATDSEWHAEIAEFDEKGKRKVWS